MKYLISILFCFSLVDSFSQKRLDLSMDLAEEFKLIAEQKEIRLKVYQTYDSVSCLLIGHTPRSPQ